MPLSAWHHGPEGPPHKGVLAGQAYKQLAALHQMPNGCLCPGVGLDVFTLLGPCLEKLDQVHAGSPRRDSEIWIVGDLGNRGAPPSESFHRSTSGLNHSHLPDAANHIAGITPGLGHIDHRLSQFW